MEQVTQELAHLVQAQVSASKLTGDVHWDGFLQLLQGRLDDLLEAEVRARDILLSPEVVGIEEMTRAKIDGVSSRAQIDILEWAMTLPKEMRKASSNAKDTLRLMHPEDPA